MMSNVILAFNPKDFFGMLRRTRDLIHWMGMDKELKRKVLFISIPNFLKGEPRLQLVYVL